MKTQKHGTPALASVLALAAAAIAAGASPRPEAAHAFGYVALRDGARISYTLYRPASSGRFPTLLLYNMYDASIVAPDWNQTASTEVAEFLDAGYAVMGANVRGTACSTGALDPLDADQVGRDGAEITEWIARQPWSDGRVGMFGHSGSGITQFYVAAHNPAPLRAIMPGAAPADFYRDIGYPGGLFNYTFMYQWGEQAQPSQALRAAKVHVEAGDRECGERLRSAPKNRTFQDLAERPLDNAWYVRHSIYSVASRIKVPTFVVFGWQDQSVSSRAISVFDQLQGPKKMLLAEDGHNFYIRSQEVRRGRIRFFDHWVKGTGAPAGESKPITIWLGRRVSADGAPERVLQADRLPLPGTRWTELFLVPGGRLEPEPPREPGASPYLYPAGAAFVYGGDRYPHLPAEIGGLVFKTKPFPRETLILGPGQVRLHLSSTQPDTSLQLVLNELDGSGGRKYLQRGYLKASMREATADPALKGTLRYPFTKALLLQPGRVTALDVELHPTGSVIEAGHALELLVMAPTVAPEPFGQWGFAPLPMAINTLHMSAEHPSRVLLPFVD